MTLGILIPPGILIWIRRSNAKASFAVVVGVLADHCILRMCEISRFRLAGTPTTREKENAGLITGPALLIYSKCGLAIVARNPNKPSAPVGNIVAGYECPFVVPSFKAISMFVAAFKVTVVAIAVFKLAVIVAVFTAAVAVAVYTFKIVSVLSLCVLH